MTTHKEALTLALEALEGLEALLLSMGLTHLIVYGDAEKAITAIKEALAQPEQVCRDDGRCQYAIDHGAEGLGHCPKGKCVMPAQPEQEPVAHMNQHGVIHEAGYPWGPTNRLEPLYTTPPQRKPLTDEEISAEVEKELTHYWNGEYIDTTGARDHLTAFARAIEAAHGIKENT